MDSAGDLLLEDPGLKEGGLLSGHAVNNTVCISFIELKILMVVNNQKGSLVWWESTEKEIGDKDMAYLFTAFIFYVNVSEDIIKNNIISLPPCHPITYLHFIFRHGTNLSHIYYIFTWVFVSFPHSKASPIGERCCFV